MMKTLFCRASIVILLFFITGGLSALSPAAWQYLTSKHFTVSYTKSTAKYAEAAITCAENTLDVLGSSFGYIPGEKISIVLKDDLDYSNGGAAALILYIEIYCRFVPFQYRLQREWLQTVISHELSHIYSLRKFAPVLLWNTDFEVRSSDWNSSLGVSLPVIGMPYLPRWFVEGMAQLGSWQYKADYRDPYREMVLRDSFLNNKLLSLEEMSRFEGNSRDYELVYNQGFDFILFLAGKYPGIPQGTLGRNIIKYGFTAAFEKTYGNSLAELHKQWLASLAVRYKDIPRTTVQGTRVFNRSSLLNVETAAINNSEYVLANWNSESSACRIFKRSANGTYRPISNETCYALKYDRKTGTGWFNRAVPNPDTFTETYDIFRIGYNYGISRQTTNSRSLCFDVLDNHLYYARYKDGITDIMHRIPDGWEISLYTFWENQSVMSLAVLTPDKLLITIGEQTGAVLLTGNKIARLWEGYDIIDPVSAGDNRVLFVSTLDGTPQLYWTDLSGATDTWYKLTSVPGGVRFPSYENREGNDIIYYSVYENGSFNLYSRTNPFRPDNGIAYKDFPHISVPVPVRGTTPSWQQTGSSLIFTPAVFTTGLLLSGMLFDNDAEKFLTAEIDFSAAVLNAPGNFRLDYGVTLDYPFVLNSQHNYADQIDINTHIVNSIQFPYIDITLYHSLYVRAFIEPDSSSIFDLNSYTIPWYENLALASVSFSLLPGILTNELTYNLYSQEFPDQVDTNFFQQSFNIKNNFNFHEIRMNLDYYQNQTLTKLGTGSDYYYPGNDYFTNSILYIPSAELIYSPLSPYRVDPARLGQDQTYLLAGLQLPSLSLPEYYNESDSPLVSFQFLNINTDLFWQKLLENRTISFSFRFQGFSYVYAETEQDAAYMILPTVNQYFPVYPGSSGALKELIKASVGIRINPFVKAEKPTHWYEQMYLALNAEGGLALYLEDYTDYYYSGEKELKLAYPLVLNFSFSQQLYFNPASPVNLDIAFLYPVTEFNGTVPHPAVRIEIKK